MGGHLGLHQDGPLQNSHHDMDEFPFFQKKKEKSNLEEACFLLGTNHMKIHRTWHISTSGDINRDGFTKKDRENKLFVFQRNGKTIGKPQVLVHFVSRAHLFGLNRKTNPFKANQSQNHREQHVIGWILLRHGCNRIYDPS